MRPFHPHAGSRWIGNAIAYGPHRDGQRPGGPSPSTAEIRQDLQLMAQHWGLLRVYSASAPTATILAAIRADSIPMQVMLGVWIDAEEKLDAQGKIVERRPAAATANRLEIDTALQLIADYPGIITSVCVGNETQVFWSAHRLPAERLIASVREVRARTALPVSVADDFNFWNKPESRAVAREVDFIVTHAHPLWNGKLLDEALEWTRQTLAAVQAEHPGHTVVLGEVGWATHRLNTGEQGHLMRGRADEEQQKIFFDQYTRWVDQERIPSFFFEAFDENWKGGEEPGEVEKHWGLFRADRTPKLALRGS